LLRTKTGIAIGKRDQARRSVSGLRRFTCPRGNGLNTSLSQLWGQTEAENGGSGTKACLSGTLPVPASQSSRKCGTGRLDIGEKLKAGAQSQRRQSKTGNRESGHSALNLHDLAVPILFHKPFLGNNFPFRVHELAFFVDTATAVT
jgi:hypothetical protein